MTDQKMKTASSYTLKKTQDAFDLGFMQPQLRTVPDAASLLSGVYGHILMAQWQIDFKENGIDARKLGKDALEALQILAELKNAFDAAFDATDPQKPILNRLTEAFYTALRASPPGPFEYGFWSDPFTALLEKKLDCDLASYLFIQFAESKGCHLVGAHVITFNSDEEDHYAAAAVGLDGKPSLFIDTILLIPTPELANTPKMRELLLRKTLRTPEEFKMEYKDFWTEDPRDGGTPWEAQNRLQKMEERVKNKRQPEKKETDLYGTKYLKDLEDIVAESANGGDRAAQALFGKKRAEYERNNKKNADFKSEYLYGKFMIKVRDLFPTFVSDAELDNLYTDGIRRFGKEKANEIFGE